MAKLADAPDLESGSLHGLRVRVPPAPPTYTTYVITSQLHWAIKGRRYVVSREPVATIEMLGYDAERWTVFTPERGDVRLVAVCEACIGHVIQPRSGVREVYVVEDSEEHYREHEGEFDLERAEMLLPGILANPLRIHRDKKPSCLIFSGEFDARYFLLVPVKCLPGEMWLQTLYICEKRNFLKRGWVKAGCLYVREE